MHKCLYVCAVVLLVIKIFIKSVHFNLMYEYENKFHLRLLNFVCHEHAEIHTCICTYTVFVSVCGVPWCAFGLIRTLIKAHMCDNSSSGKC